MRWAPSASSRFFAPHRAWRRIGRCLCCKRRWRASHTSPDTPACDGLAICYSVYQISWGVLVVVVPVAVTHALGSTANADMVVGALWSDCGCAGALGALATGKVPLIGRGRQMIVFSFAIIGVAIYPLSASFGLLGLAAGLVVIGLLEGPADVALLTLRQRRTEPQWLGRVLTVSMCP